MAAVLPGFLRVIGWILLILLLVVAAFVALLLFFPFTYRAKIRADEAEKKISGTLTWLFSFLRVSFTAPFGEGSEGGPGATVRLIGIPILRFPGGGKKKDKRGKKEEYTGAKIRPSVVPRAERTAPEKPGPEVEIFRPKRPNAFQRLGAKISAFIGKIKKLFARVREILDFIRSEPFSRGARVLKKEGLALLKHVKPRRIHGRVAFGFDDPSATGRMLGILGICYPILPPKLQIEPDFTEKKLEADLQIRGHFFGIVLLVRALKILFNKDVRALRRRFSSGGRRKDTETKKGMRKAG